MRTIDKILADNNATIEGLRTNKICNGCGGKGGINFSQIMRSLPYFNEGKGKQLEQDLELVCCLHDIAFNKGGCLIDFIKANYKLAINVIRLLHWTNTFGRLSVFILVFGGTTLFGGKYFNWK